jgi:murein DD-endopeptidase MepM/ murein hydrolase activator NlpD
MGRSCSRNHSRPADTFCMPWRAFIVGVCAAAIGMTGSMALPSSASASTETKTRDALAIAREKLDSARADADDAAARLSAIEGDRAQVVAEISGLEIEIPQLQARAVELKILVKQRAASLYVRGGSASLDAFLNAGDTLAAAQAAHLTNVVAAHDVDLATELRATATKLATRESALRTKRAALDHDIELVTTTRDELDHKLVLASGAYDKVKIAVAAQRAKGTGATLVSAAMRCPVDGFVAFADDFGEPRDAGTTHEGIDMQAVLATPLVAVVDGDMTHDESPAGGHGIWLKDDTGDTYYYAHLSKYEGNERRVAAGDVIGYIGITGVTTGPHLHFELHPRAGEAVDPFALLLGLCIDEQALPKPKPA